MNRVLPQRQARFTTALLFLVLFCSVLLCNPKAQAQSLQDMQVTARVLGFLDPPLRGTLRLAIVHDPGNTNSRRQAENILQLMGSGLQAGSIILQGTLMPLDSVIAMQGADYDVFFLAEIPAARTTELSAALNHYKKPCATTDITLVRNAVCSISVQSSPRVEIIVNRNLAELREIRFASAFRMMILEI